MFDQDQLGEIKKGIFKAWLKWLLGLFLIVNFIYIAQNKPNLFEIKIGPDIPIDFLRYALYALIACELYLIPFCRNKELLGNVHDISSKIRRLPVQEQLDTIISKYNDAVTVSIALSESIAIFGFMFFLITKEYHSLYLFTSIGAIAMTIYRPKIYELKQYANSVIAQPNA